VVSRRFALAALGVAAALGLAPATAGAVPFNPSDFDLITPDPIGGNFSVDTDALKFGGFTGEERDGVAVFTLAGGSGLGNLTVTGDRPLAILFQGIGGILGTIDIGGGDGMDEPAPGFGGPGGGEGENSIGGGIANFGGAGGGFGGRGANSGGIGTAQGGEPYGDLALALSGGSGGAGGGALEIGANGMLLLLGAIIDASGGNGGPGLQGGGGGSGGGVLLHGFDVLIDPGTFIDVSGGDGSKFGGGGGGRVHVETNSSGTLFNAGTINTGGGFGCFDSLYEGVFSTASSEQMGLALAQVSASVPEPGTAAMFGLGLAGVFAAGRRRRTATR